MKRLLTPAIVVLFAAAGYLYATRASSAEDKAQEPSAVAATLDGRTITTAEVDREIQRKPALSMRKAMAKDDAKALTELRYAALNGIINRALLLDAAKKSGIVDEKEVAASLDKVVGGYGGEEQLASLLPSIGTTLPEFKSEVSDDFRIAEYVDKTVAKDVKVPNDEIKQAFEKNKDHFAEPERVRARHILVKTEKNASDADLKAAEKKINDLHDAVTKPGADFAKIAAESSDCPSKKQGGDLGYFSRGDMVPEFEKAAFALKPGEISTPIKTQFGYHIIKLEDHKDAGKPDFDKAKPEIELELKREKVQALVEVKVQELRKAAKLDIKLPSA
jgi:peptidyl-prolyl cis-trans isomerase C